MDADLQRFLPFQAGFEALEWVGLFFLVVIIAEALFDVISKRRKLKESAANFAIYIGNIVIERTLFGLIFIIGLLTVDYFIFWDIPVSWWSGIAAVILADFTYYWMHRCEHRVRLLWAYHSVHHSSPEFNLSTSMRLSWVEGVFEWLFFVPMVVIGFDAVQVLLAISIVAMYQTWIHTERVGQLVLLEGIVNTPSVHRVHHGHNGEYIDKNFGGILMCWDRLFGTYQQEHQPVDYGISEPLNSSNPLVINFKEFYLIANDLRKSQHYSHALGYLFGPPGWRPVSDSNANNHSHHGPSKSP